MAHTLGTMRAFGGMLAAVLIGAAAWASQGNARPWTAMEADVDAGLRQAELALERVTARYPFLWQGSSRSANPQNDRPPKIVQVYRHLGELYLLEGRDFATGYLVLGQSRAMQRDYAGARATFETGLANTPSADLAYGVGWCILREAGPESIAQRTPKQIEQAVAAFEHALKLDPDHCLSLNSLAYCHYWLAVLAHATTPPKVDPETWPAHVDAALAAWQHYLKLCSATSRIYYLMGELHHTRGEFQQTAHYWELAFQMGGELPGIDRLAQLYEHDLKDRTAAERVLNAAAKREKASSQSTGAKRELAHFWLRHGRYDEAIRYFGTLAEQTPSAWTFFELGQALETAGRPAEALTWYRRAKDRNPSFTKSLDQAITRATARLPAD